MHTLSEYTPPNKRYRHTDAHDLLTKATVPAASTHDKKNNVIAGSVDQKMQMARLDWSRTTLGLLLN